jgi:uncharacterized protein (TIGR03437 family)
MIMISAAAPGIFETSNGSGGRTARAVRPDGSFVSVSNPAQLGEYVRIYATGLGAYPANTATGTAGRGENIGAEVIAGVNNAGVTQCGVVRAENLIGIAMVCLQIPQNTVRGNAVPLALAAMVNGSPVFAAGSSLPVQ